MTIDLFGLTITSEKSSKNSHAFHPQFFLRHTGILGTLAFTVASVTAFPAGFGVLTNPGTGVDGNGLFDDLKLWNGKKMSKTRQMFHLTTKLFRIENSDEIKPSLECQFSVKEFNSKEHDCVEGKYYILLFMFRQVITKTYQTVLDELANVLPGVGIGNLVDFVGVQPNLVFATFHYTSG